MGIIHALIELKYQNAQSCAGELEEIAEAVVRLADNDIDDVLRTTDAAWDGDSSIVCCNKILGLERTVKGTGLSLRNAAKATRIISDNVRRAELMTLAIAYRRRY